MVTTHDFFGVSVAFFSSTGRFSLASLGSTSAKTPVEPLVGSLEKGKQIQVESRRKQNQQEFL
jgi:hypothetical protein